MPQLGRLLIILGIIFILTGIVFSLNLGGKLSFLGRLPGDIHIKKDDFVFYFPFTTSILISILLSAVFYLYTKK
ncbi:MAG: DUF2905 domain-containing protein [Candidatus Omnitrophica bacterium]|nr:DUF2905 domain-containing protein [Candidatus Omnitrophota bacterium]